MIFAIKFSKVCYKIFDKLGLTTKDITRIMNKHAKQYAFQPYQKAGEYFICLKPGKKHKLDPLGLEDRNYGYIGWISRDKPSGVALQQEFNEWAYRRFSDATLPQVVIFSEPPGMERTFNFGALGLDQYIELELAADDIFGGDHILTTEDIYGTEEGLEKTLG